MSLPLSRFAYEFGPSPTEYKFAEILHNVLGVLPIVQTGALYACKEAADTRHIQGSQSYSHHTLTLTRFICYYSMLMP